MTHDAKATSSRNAKLEKAKQKTSRKYFVHDIWWQICVVMPMNGSWWWSALKGKVLD